MRAFFKTFCLLSMIYFVTIIFSQSNPSKDKRFATFEIYADPDKIEDIPDLPPITNSPPSDSIIYMPDGSIVILH